MESVHSVEMRQHANEFDAPRFEESMPRREDIWCFCTSIACITKELGDATFRSLMSSATFLQNAREHTKRCGQTLHLDIGINQQENNKSRTRMMRIVNTSVNTNGSCN
jgi:hypothetical protein